MVPELVMPPPLKENWIALALLNGAMAQIIAIRYPRRKYRLVNRFLLRICRIGPGLQTGKEYITRTLLNPPLEIAIRERLRAAAGSLDG
jgi:hypothetical protein